MDRPPQEHPHSEALLASILQTPDVDVPASGRPSGETHAHYVERLKDRRVQLSNPDRKRPNSGGGDARAGIRAESKLTRRKRRVKAELARIKRLRIGMTQEVRRREEQEEGQEVEGRRRGRDDGGKERETVKEKQRELAEIKKQERKTRSPSSSSSSMRTKGKRVERNATKPLTRSQRKAIGLERVDANVEYELMQPLHELWTSYIQQLLGFTVLDASTSQLVPNPSFNRPGAGAGGGVGSLNNLSSGAVSAIQGSLIKADLCGALVHVVRSSNPSLVNQSGLVVKETERTLVIAPRPRPQATSGGESHSPSPKTRVVPKHNTVFAIDIPLPGDNVALHRSVRFELHGNHMMHSLPSRATRKFKARATTDF
ncbi:related to POP4 - protein involved in processing of tRNAs and rRNAs [Pseudozyma flocculosa]|uniref:Related to POP4 - protein involved in processing of tRNAs and rRNAs n=1 Tax=Pseudozyma flocculosa TaxID=84751 RepID=A0A5C3F5L1_9BASI|nr:related to POP4 - protein involved in processing of tRNAs and rRNAs [Pseudozyma flocculosa]